MPLKVSQTLQSYGCSAIYCLANEKATVRAQIMAAGGLEVVEESKDGEYPSDTLDALRMT